MATTTTTALTLNDLTTILQATRHNRNYNIPRVAQILYQYYVLHTPQVNIAAHLFMSPSGVRSVRKDALLRIRRILPLLSDRQVSKLYNNTHIHRGLWPLPTMPKTH